ncbi:ABC transporter substrate-binding protein [Noviherbaspirillum sp. UKPF54]|uniref:ABC transporter substrate-binding protein n=1 Tax=Noviherbaspirillum sp. UKPF54 TaxID=2601898 RepID=UPI0011B153C8|nr:ABC transporter substrate-binding protein [Noviherbaspirillum sp. UKPF54]QDZ29846.1 substrate-binding domain-containing protein [Noviherbaspirillum sp. UKPF54]
MRRQITACVGLLLGLASPLLWASAFSVVFINPGRSDEPFWRSVTRFMQPAAQQLGIELEVLYAERDHLKMIELVQQVTQRRRKPNYLMIVNEKLAGGEMLKLADRAGIKTLVTFSTFEGAQVAEFGQPRQKYRNWIGSLTPSAAEAGRLSALELVQQARRLGVVASDGKVHVAAIAGDKATPTATQRLAGAVRAFAGDSSVVLEQVVYGNWDRARAREQAQALMLRYPQLNAFWAASDLMAYGAMEAAEADGRTAGQDLLFSAINNSPEVLQARLDGRISALAGGHFAAGAFGLVMLYDYHHGRDFRSEGLQLRPQLFLLLDERRARVFLERFGNEDFSSVDFRRFSKHLRPRLRRYRFSLRRELQ